MERVILLQVSLILLVFSTVTYGAMSEAQLKAAARLVKNMCQPKHKATDEDIEKMHQGDWSIDRATMCYMHCVLSSNRLITKENVLDVETASTLAKKNLPVARRDLTLTAIDDCKGSAKTLDDKCAAAYEIAKCIYESNPENYFLP